MKRRNKIITLGLTTSVIVIAGYYLLYGHPSESAKHNPSETSNNNNQLKEENNEHDTDIAKPLQESIDKAISDFEDKMRFPTYSVPLDEYAWDKLNPREFAATPKPIFNQDGLVTHLGDTQVIFELDSFVVNIQYDLPVKIKAISGQQGSGVDLAQASIWLTPFSERFKSEQGETFSLSSSWQASVDDPAVGNWVYSGVVPARVLKSFGESNVYLIAELTFADGTEAKSGAAIKLFESMADLRRIGDAYVEGPHLMIPVELNVQTPGYFRVTANLFDKTGVLPIAHLTEQIKTEQTGLIQGAFKVHIATLKEADNPGPYTLKTISISKLPTKPDYQPRYGAYDKGSYRIAGFDFDLYKDEAYVDPDMARRLEALKKIASGN